MVHLIDANPVNRVTGQTPQTCALLTGYFLYFLIFFLEGDYFFFQRNFWKEREDRNPTMNRYDTEYLFTSVCVSEDARETPQ